MPPDHTHTLTQAIKQTLQYADLFDHALTAVEIHRYLVRHAAPPKMVAQQLESMTRTNQLVSSGRCYALAGRNDLFATKLEREARAKILWQKALYYGRWLAQTPFARMIAVTGSLATNHPNDKADIDYMIITELERVWLCRLFSLPIVRYAQKDDLHLCPNFFLSINNLSFSAHNAYTARELCQMVPLTGHTVYNQLRQANLWTTDWLPNATGRPTNQYQSSLNNTGQPQKTVERFLSGSAGNKLEKWERERKIAKLSAQGQNDETNFSAVQCKGHFDGHQQKTLSGLAKTMKQDNIQPQNRITDILFGQSYYLRFDPKLWEAMKPYPPLGTMYAAAYMREQGFNVQLFDAMLAPSTAVWQAQIQQHKPRYAVIYEDNFNYLSKMCLLNMREAALEMISHAKEIGATVILCGSDATDHTDLYLNGGADFVIRGEGEQTLSELIRLLEEGNTAGLQTLQGINYLRDGQVQNNLPRPNMNEIDHLPFPAWDLVDVAQYKQIWLDNHGYFSMNMVTTRGCPYHCNWCAKPIWGQRYASRSAENVVQELVWLKQQYQPDHIWFADDIMGLKPKWWQEFADLIETHNVRTPFKCLSRADLIVRQSTNVDALKRAGCEIVWLGAESGAQKILDAMEKGTTVEQIYEAAEQLHGAGVGVAFFLQFGYPGETREDIEKTLQMVRDCQPNDVGMSVSYPLPGTTFYERVRIELGTQENWTDSADLAMMYQGPFSTSFYRQLHSVLHKEFRSRKGWLMLQQVMTKPQKWRVKHGRELLAIVYRFATLPFAQRKLNQLARENTQVNVDLPHMSLADAARPSPQTNE